MSSPGQPGAGSGSDSRPRQVMNVAVLAESELGSEAQRERRKRILDATLAIASKGGYEAVQMRAVAERADVAVGTLYRYFPSKVHLLVSALGREFERIDAKTDRAALSGGTPYQRLNLMVGKLNRAMQRNPLLTEAMTRAVVFADASASRPRTSTTSRGSSPTSGCRICWPGSPGGHRQPMSASGWIWLSDCS
jgi:TetR/AcrR family transcriptional regulator, cholesterol catabolism regulator